MGTLPSCSSFVDVNLKLRSSWPVSTAFAGTIRIPMRPNKAATTTKAKSLCFLCRKSLDRSFGGFRCYSSNDSDKNGGIVGEESGNLSNDPNVTATAPPEEAKKEKEEERRSRNEFDLDKAPASVSSPPPTISPFGPGYNNFQLDSFKLMELLGPEKVDPADVKLIKDRLFGYSTFWVTKEEPFGDLGEGILFLGNLRGNREEVFAKLQKLLVEVTGNKYNLFMVEEPNAEDLDPRGGPRVSFGLLRKDVWFGNIHNAWTRSAWWTFVTSLGTLRADMSEVSGETMLKRRNRGWNMEESSCGSGYFSRFVDAPPSMGRACGGDRCRSSKHIMMHDTYGKKPILLLNYIVKK